MVEPQRRFGRCQGNGTVALRPLVRRCTDAVLPKGDKCEDGKRIEPTQLTCPLEVAELLSSVTVTAVTIKYIKIEILTKIYAFSP
jgi:hypothetical protein